jgi:ABC-type uncharacterized transport system ATPase subunit
MAQAEELCDRVVMIHKGRKVLDQPMASLRRQFDTSRVLFEPLESGPDDAAALREIPGVASVTGSGGEYELGLVAGSDAGMVMREASGRIAPARVDIARRRFRQLFARAKP